ncbi:TPA: hypothetical protein ACXIGC_001096 [Stenotrophomonas maltophilia]|uniref:hypothetical protein n=1 Tax=Stenotrophomonas maltophilia TaxID=40324 RepID=UPI000C15FA09|nr:hypothetical protein [Stenotrophomonas maltophilia]HEL5579781.1 hypothetical protein [Stenotrophomonas maltophilia]
MSTTKNKGGRPPRAPGEKLQRINMTLRPSLLFGLEVVARDRRTSLSQAAEYLIEQQLRSYQVEGAPATKLLDGVVDVMRDHLSNGNPLVEKEPDDAEEVAALLLASPSGRAFFMPDTLQTPSERYFLRFYASLLRIANEAAADGDELASAMLMTVMSSLARPDLLERLHSAANDGEQKGSPVDEAARSTYAQLMAVVAGP